MSLRKIYYAIIAFIFFCVLSSSVDAQVAVIANKSVNTKNIDINALNNLYNLQSNEIGSQKVKLFFIKEESETSGKILKTIGKNLSELKKVWLKAKLTGNGNPPEMISGEQGMLEKVSATPGAVGFVNASVVNSNVNVLLIIN